MNSSRRTAAVRLSFTFFRFLSGHASYSAGRVGVFVALLAVPFSVIRVVDLPAFILRLTSFALLRQAECCEF